MRTAPALHRNTTAVASYLRRAVPDVPVTARTDGSGFTAGINVFRFIRPDLPSPTYPYRGTVVHVMYDIETEASWQAWKDAAREALLAKYAERYRPMPGPGEGWFLIEDPNTKYSRERAAEYLKRAGLGFPALHTLGK